MTDMREAVARARLALNNQRQCDETGEMCIVSRQALNEVLAVYDAMQPEIDRRVAEERAKLLEQLLSLPPSIYDGPTRYISFDQVLAQFEKENP